ncbi:MAG: hypothetical protein J3R72DRAFT_432647 [Linnemannia gamsii]|nr:MAG: hypothetical protein J3R72DRAFT_432647 [Linnemannia gamsii]
MVAFFLHPPHSLSSFLSFLCLFLSLSFNPILISITVLICGCFHFMSRTRSIFQLKVAKKQTAQRYFHSTAIVVPFIVITVAEKQKTEECKERQERYLELRPRVSRQPQPHSTPVKPRRRGRRSRKQRRLRPSLLRHFSLFCPLCPGWVFNHNRFPFLPLLPLRCKSPFFFFFPPLTWTPSLLTYPFSLIYFLFD